MFKDIKTSHSALVGEIIENLYFSIEHQVRDSHLASLHSFCGGFWKYGSFSWVLIGGWVICLSHFLFVLIWFHTVKIPGKQKSIHTTNQFLFFNDTANHDMSNMFIDLESYALLWEKKKWMNAHLCEGECWTTWIPESKLAFVQSGSSHLGNRRDRRRLADR